MDPFHHPFVNLTLEELQRPDIETPPRVTDIPEFARTNPHSLEIDNQSFQTPPNEHKKEEPSQNLKDPDEPCPCCQYQYQEPHELANLAIFDGKVLVGSHIKLDGSLSEMLSWAL